MRVGAPLRGIGLVLRGLGSPRLLGRRRGIRGITRRLDGHDYFLRGIGVCGAIRGVGAVLLRAILCAQF